MLWHQLHSRVEEEALARGLRPRQVLARTVAAAAADWHVAKRRRDAAPPPAAGSPNAKKGARGLVG